MPTIVRVDGSSLSPQDIVLVARRESEARLARGVAKRMSASRRVVEEAIRSGRTVYGVNTGFGHLAQVRIEAGQVKKLQVNLIRSHAAGVGPAADDETVRALLLLRANVLARGHSGVRPKVARQLLDMLAADLLPVVPMQGSVGASGDLAPLAHVALVAIGEGRARYGGREMPARRALERAGLEPLELEAKEGIAMVNGTQFSAALAALALERARRLAATADFACVLTLEGLLGSTRPLDERIHQARGQEGQSTSAANMRALMHGSGIEASHADCARVQDAYSLRCAPQVHGAARDALAQLTRILTIEINASTDNPMVFAAEDDAEGVMGETISGGNFHGAPLAAAVDYAALAMTTLASIVERRTDRLVNPLVSELPAFLAKNPGLESGLMMCQVTSASLVTECKTLASPASVDTIPTSANQEDHVSMAPWAARKLVMICERLEILLAIELLAGLKALAYRRPLRGSEALEAGVKALTTRVSVPQSGDFVPAPVIAALAEAVREGVVLEALGAAGVNLR